MKILGIETSCDETSAAVIEARPKDNKVRVLSNIVTSSLNLHSKTGGIIPEIAARQQIKYIIPVIDKALKESILNLPSSKNNLSSTIYRPAIDAIAVTVGPGLIGSLLVGVETAKTLAFAWNKSIVPVNHLIGHIYANFISSKLNALPAVRQGKRYLLDADIEFPALILIVSGGHTDLVLMKNHASPAMPEHRDGGRGNLKWIGGTRDDAAGEAFDKIGRLLNLPYPGGPIIEKKAEKGNPKAFNFPKPMIDSNNFDFSFSGLKTAVLREVKTIEQLNNETIANISASVQQAVIDVLIAKTLKAAVKYNAKSILLSGGVAANQKLREELKLKIENLKLKIPFFAPEKWLCTDNAAMIATAAFFNYKPVDWKQIVADPQLHFSLPCLPANKFLYKPHPPAGG